jgi:hypothetical protein
MLMPTAPQLSLVLSAALTCVACRQTGGPIPGIADLDHIVCPAPTELRVEKGRLSVNCSGAFLNVDLQPAGAVSKLATFSNELLAQQCARRHDRIEAWIWRREGMRPQQILQLKCNDTLVVDYARIAATRSTGSR